MPSQVVLVNTMIEDKNVRSTTLIIHLLCVFYGSKPHLYLSIWPSKAQLMCHICVVYVSLMCHITKKLRNNVDSIIESSEHARGTKF